MGIIYLREGRPYVLEKEALERRFGEKVPLDEPVITPDAIPRSERLVTVLER